MKTKPWENRIPQIAKVKNRKRLFRRWKNNPDEYFESYWTLVGFKWLTPKEITFYNLIDDCLLEEITQPEHLNEAVIVIPVDSAEWLLHK